ncbi:MAG: acyl-CoA dehydrogenase family protein, partial [Pseudomonadota bacterium]
AAASAAQARAAAVTSIAASRYLNLRAATIYSGSSEIQREIIAREVLRP